ncbi:2-amino-4-hydroxy-6-hydroxymethyldihydropteridine diphosphokinase [Amycolatopsis acidiphila]|uniref:2-amino-4-hydroxy-6-hydroxymethyldihydropteridine diphosphokinase n=1 Tax=Amycolatopsis acidiphila TaxID=715473 RepID=A0A557ZS08_9PSEU|nr:2-amino-4-hydroxy-6-hydroxymethyldihydropteridine diphosphokinase [Amycolatopsis acidiphila]TVT14772.1 2-amino-4-hydroxy-6-hydroxymethyldihydropteridine diphosphokinase [Amycolatopsis acidiphila]UIJ59446.1 2-amino-4-hydroxy-6-hydroxymethyldihydropteridine diphosphokinase [Amycolatopsis acidiphila]GHG94524.1 2-amino-4-hydroxy-6-hydroxymethyldihydropteridine diphosphokinase [Amycolatopsis acidiphila]
MSRAVLSLGSNLGDRLGRLRSVVTGLGEAVVRVSTVYETKPWGVEDQPDFLNAVCIVDDPARDHWAWLRAGQALEQAAGRVRELRWGPRTLDVDVVTVDGVRSADPELLLPHPGTPERASVLIPWLEIDPDATLPGHGPVRDLLAALPEADRAGVRPRRDLAL